AEGRLIRARARHAPAGYPADGPGAALYRIGPVWGRHRQGALRLPGTRRDRALEDLAGRAGPAPAVAPEARRLRPGRVRARRRLRARAGRDEPLALPGHRPDTARGGRDAGVPRAAWRRRRRFAAFAGRAVGRARRHGRAPACSPEHPGGDGPRPRGRDVRAARRGLMGLLHPPQRQGRGRVPGRDGARDLVVRRHPGPSAGRRRQRRLRPPRPEAPALGPRRRDPLLRRALLPGALGPENPPDPRLRRPYEPGARRRRPRRLPGPRRAPGLARRRRRTARHHGRRRRLALRRAQRGRI
ncbi:MAG: Integral membrane protein, partial [uncultured Rubrobacteraceae bacterium]